MTTESAIPTINMDVLLGTAENNPIPATPLEKALATVEPDDAAAVEMSQVKFQFRDLLDGKQLTSLKKAGPGLSVKMVNSKNEIIQFGEPVLTKLNSTSVQLLEAQKDIEIPEAEVIVNDLLREIDGYSAKYRNKQIEGAVDRIVSFFKGAGYSLKAMVRESKPIVDKIDLAEVQLRQMELKLADNVTRGEQLHGYTTDSLKDVVAVLAALEEVIEVTRKEYNEIDAIVTAADKASTKDSPVVTVDYKGEKVSLNELRDLHSRYATGASEMEQTWFDWRQQFFLGYATAPSILNLALVSYTMQRRCQVFRTMGLPAARRSLAMWQQAALAKEGAKVGTAVQEGTNKLIQESFEATGQAVTEVAMASQTPTISEETIFTVINSVKAQCEGLVAADKWGREMRSKSITALEAGEASIQQDFTNSRRALVANAMSAVQQPQELAPVPDEDVLKTLGVKA